MESAITVRGPLRSLSLAIAVFSLAACASSSSSGVERLSTPAPGKDPRVGLRAGLMDAGQAAWNLRLVSNTPPSEKFVGVTNSDLSFIANYVIQGNYNGFEVWDISNPARPTLKIGYLCPASQSDVSVYRNLLFVSGEGTGGRLDCGTQGVHDSVSAERLRGIRIFDVSDIANPKYLANVQTCRGSHTHTVVIDPHDTANVYIYVSGSAPVRSPNELPGCVKAPPDSNPSSALFRIEVIKVPLAAPQQAAIVSSPRIFDSLTEAPRHAEAPEDIAAAAQAAAAARARGGFTASVSGLEYVLPPQFIGPMLDSVVRARQGTGAPTGADSTALRAAIQGIVDALVGATPPGTKNGARPAKLLFSDEWGGGGAPKCRATDKPEWGADAIFTLVDNRMTFQSYYKMPAPQTPFENCVAHNGSLIPIPGRDVMVQGWYQGGISVFDWTDPAHPKEIAFFDRGPVDSTKLASGGSWSAYWYNGYIYSSEIARGLDVFELKAGPLVSQNEIDAAKLVHLDFFNTQDQPKLVWPASFPVARAYLDQLARSNGLAAPRVAALRHALERAEKLSGQARRDALTQVAKELDADAQGAADQAKVRMLATAVTDLVNAQP